MLQRIQTIYLLAVTSLMSLFLFGTLATFSNATNIYTMTAFSIKAVDGTVALSFPYLIALTGLSALLPFVNIFLFKNRMLQIRLCVVEMILALGTLIVAGVHIYLANRTFGADGDFSIRIVCALPLFALLFNYLALKAIFKDEMLIKSLDRIR